VRFPADLRVIAGSSTKQQAARELEAGRGYVNERVVGYLVERRAREGEERERRRKARELRWRGIADGSIEALSVPQVAALWSDASDPYVPSRASNGRGGRRGRAAQAEQAGLDKLLEAVKDGEPVAV
jgi:hypothetical protein